MPTFEVLDWGGVDTLLRVIGLEIKVSGREVVGIVVDADGDVNARWDAVVGRLREAGIKPPGSREPTGTIIDGPPRIGIWLMPDNESSGDLEDFVEGMIPPGDPIWPKSEAYIDGIPDGDRKFAASKVLKAKLYAWLATRETPGRMGSAIHAGDLRVDGPLGTKFADWLRKLFG